MFGKLYIVATPIGNLDDVTLRAINILSEVDIILAEDTRVARKLMTNLSGKFSISNFPADSGLLAGRQFSNKNKLVKLISYHQHSTDEKRLQILKSLVEGKNIALITDAGTPGVSDPGNELIDYVIEKESKIQIVSVPGPSALTAALSVCGFNVTRFIFAGFLPKMKKGKLFTQVKSTGLPLVFFESPRRILKTLQGLGEEFGEERQIFVARELTKMHETTYRGSIKGVKEQLEKDILKGEIVVIFE